jgi:tetraacyldisaccharide 4'-kinase
MTSRVEKRRPDELLRARGGPRELLRLPAALYGIVTDLRAGLYDRGWLPAAKLDAPVVSVGNLTAGGTGKTPFVVFLVRELAGRGRRPGVLSRGYRARETEGGPTRNDEGRMLAELLPDVPHVQDPDRVRGGRALVARGTDVIVLDDGFQHRRLRRDLDLVLIDASRPWGLPGGPSGERPVRALLPRGLLRERPRNLRRADALVLTRSDQVEEAQRAALVAELQELAPGLPVLLASHRPARLVGPDGSDHPSALRGREVDLVSGLGNPAAFERTVRDLGARIHEHRSFRDHHDYAPPDLDGLGKDGRWIVTTAKDGVKLDGTSAPVRVLQVEVALDEGAAVLAALLDALQPGRAEEVRRSMHEGLHG